MAPGFVPNVFVDISAQLERKLEAISLFASAARFPA
jgi:LmbE family N-acetylglucosaminyl deacetylase